MQLLNYEIVGEGENKPWVVFIHGAGGSINTWKDQIKSYSKHFRLLLLDLRDHGKSKQILPEHDTYTLEIISEDILHLLKHLNIQKASFVSLSMGSYLIQSILMRTPEVVERCVFGGAVILGNWKIRWFTKSALWFNVVFSYKQMYTVFSYLLMPRKSHQKARKIYLHQAKKITETEYLKWLGLYDEFFRVLKKFSDWKVSIPTLILMGDQDYVFLSSALKFSNLQKNVTLSILPKSGHICNIDNSLDFNKQSLSFLLQ